MDVMRAATVGDVQTVNKCLLHTKDSLRVLSVLLYAAVYGHANICELILDSGQVTDDRYVAAALTMACASNQLSTAQLFLRRRHVNTHDLTRALSQACLYGHESIVGWLMSDVIRVSQADRIARLFTTACARGDMSDMRHRAAQINTDVTRVMSHALRVACYRGRGNVVEWLTSHTTADVSSFGEIEEKDGKVTSLMAACIKGEHDIARRLVECFTPLTVNLVSGKVHDTALHYAITGEADNQLLAASYAGDIDTAASSLYMSKVDNQVSQGYTALHYACGQGHVDFVRFLLSEFARTDITDDNRRTPAMWAEVFGQTHVLPYLQLTVAESVATAAPVSDNNNSVSISVTSVDDAAPCNNSRPRSVKSTGRLSTTRIVLARLCNYAQRHALIKVQQCHIA